MMRYMPSAIWSASDRLIWFRQRMQKLLVRRNDPAFLNMKVDFMICGAQKGGTSALTAYLKDHPQICFARRKEVHFFDIEINFNNNQPDYSVYHSYFDPQPQHTLIGEATPNYMYWHGAPQRIWKYNPKTKLIISLRNPIERAYSHWNMERERKIEYLSFLDAIKQEPERQSQVLPYQHKRYSYVDRGFYLKQLERIWSYFPKQQVLIFKQEWLRARPMETLQAVYNFLSVTPFEHVTVKDVHSRPYNSSITIEEWDYLKSIYEPEIHNLERALGWDCSDWLSR